MMRRLQLDFLSATRAPRWPGPALLAAGLLCGIAVTGAYVQTNAEKIQLETQQAEARKLLRREMPQLQRPMGDPTLVAKELDHARLVLSDLARPWDAMFGELERAAHAHVALLGVQPSSAGAAVRLRGEARSYEDLLDYIARLEQTERFGHVLLASHEEQEDGGVRFSLVTKWIQQQ